jgi:biotin-dependent carboxylase-like uncharacterized protein
VLEVVAPGLLTTVVDGGRPGFGHLGVPIGGACDRRSLALANRLLGNEPDAAALEVSLLGPELRALTDVVVAIAGADFDAVTRPSGRRVRPASAAHLELGNTLALPGPPEHGARGYIALAGGVDVPVVLGSRSTCLVAGFGGFEGRALRAGDVIPAVGVAATAATLPFVMAVNASPVVRILPGPDATDALLAGLMAARWQVSPSSDRRGVRLTGDPLPSPGDGQRLSLGVLPGTIQLPPDGQPIVLLADAQPTGGYPVIGVVIEADLPVVGQLAAAVDVRFEVVDPGSARQASMAVRSLTAWPSRDRTSS